MTDVTLTTAAGDRLPGRLVAGTGDVGIVLAHGAGAGQDHPWMTAMSRLLADTGATVLTFDYPYMAAGRRAPDRPERLLDAHRAAVDHLRRETPTVVLAGKSMGARIGSHLAGDRGVPVAALVHYGYPLVPVGKVESRDVTHLARIAAPQLFFAGTRDRLCPLDLIRPVITGLPAAELVVVEGGDHSFRMLAATGVGEAEVLASLAARTSGWLDAAIGGGGRR